MTRTFVGVISDTHGLLRSELFLNPGSAGPRRFKLPISVARLTVRGGDMKVKLIELRNAI
jgi:predicted phosphodiesterase